MNKNIANLCLWSGAVFLVMLGVGMMLLMQFIPPHSPTWSAEHVAEVYAESSLRIRLGLFVLLFGACFYLPWTALITQQIKKIEGSFSLLSCIQLASGALTVYMFTIPVMIWAAAAFRPERMPELIMLFNDFGWMMFVGMFSPFWFVPISVGVAALIDKSPNPVFPRWVGYFCIWMAILLMPGAMLLFFQTGPFAWDGILAFWLPLFATFAWFVVMFIYIRKDIKKLEVVIKVA